jgi:hypothetical protein
MSSRPSANSILLNLKLVLQVRFEQAIRSPSDTHPLQVAHPACPAVIFQTLSPVPDCRVSQNIKEAPVGKGVRLRQTGSYIRMRVGRVHHRNKCTIEPLNPNPLNSLNLPQEAHTLPTILTIKKPTLAHLQHRIALPHQLRLLLLLTNSKLLD